MPWEVVIGPPGTGKTTALMQMVREELAGGRPADEIAAVTFTRAGAKEIVTRVSRELGLGGLAMPWCRTIHSMAYKLLRVERGRIMAAKAWAAFGERFGYTLSKLNDGDVDEHANEVPTTTTDDTLRHAYEWGRSRGLTLEQTEYQYDPPFTGLHFRLYVERYEKFKTQENRLDFADLLVRSLDSAPPVRVAFVDEAQDLSPAQIACVERWFANCERVVVVGDADQAIFEFQGANPEWLTRLARATTPRILGQSYRVPAVPHAQARAIITRNADRLDAHYAPRSAMGSVEPMTLAVALRRLDPAVKTFVLVRNRKFLDEPASHCLRAGFPYLVEGNGGPSPYRREKLVRALRVALRLHDSDVCTAGELVKLLDFVPARGNGLLQYGAKAAMRKLRANTHVTDAELQVHGLGELLVTIRRDGALAVFQRDVKPSELAYFQALLDRYKDIPEPPIILTTIHGSKGREAARVIVLSDMARATWKDYQTPAGEAAENRVFYVAATRTRNELWIVLNETELYYRWPPYEPPTPPAVTAPTFTLEDLDERPVARGTATLRPAWRAEWIENISRYVVVARDDSARPAAQAAAPHLVCHTESELQLLKDLELDDALWFKIHAHLFMFPSWSAQRAVAANVPNWQARRDRRRGRKHGSNRALQP